ncbi:MAG: hypothetical protein R2684_13140 [Pyrinomonadaceae bacterium]
MKPKIMAFSLLLAFSTGCMDRAADRTTPEPPWLKAKIEEATRGRASNVPMHASRATYKQKLVYYISPNVPDGFGTLYDASGEILCHPDGGLNGRGDGRCGDFFDTARELTTIWKSDP